MDSIFAMDVESLFSTYGAKYTHQIELLSETIEICLLEGYIHNNQNKKILISSLKKRSVLNCKIKKYQNVLDDIEILKELNIIFNKETMLAWIEAEYALIFQKIINDFENAQNKCDLYYLDGHNFKSTIRHLKSLKIREWLEIGNEIDE